MNDISPSGFLAVEGAWIVYGAGARATQTGPGSHLDIQQDTRPGKWTLRLYSQDASLSWQLGCYDSKTAAEDDLAWSIARLTENRP